MASSASPPKKLNLRSTAVKRIMQEASELASADIDEDGFLAAPLEDDIFEWHCTMRGVTGSEYDGGLYHLRIVLPPSYPMSAPDIMLLTPNGRFELGKKICIDGLTSFHAGSWQPAWGVRTAVVGLRSFWMQGGEALSGVGALDCSKDERKRLAGLSSEWKCPTCGVKNEETLSRYPEKKVLKEGGESVAAPLVEAPRSAQVKLSVPTPPPTQASSEAGFPHPIPELPVITPISPADPGHANTHRDPPSTSTPAPTRTIVTPVQPSAPVSGSSAASRPVPLWLDQAIALICFLLGIAICKRVGTYIASPY